MYFSMNYFWIRGNSNETSNETNLIVVLKQSIYRLYVNTKEESQIYIKICIIFLISNISITLFSSHYKSHYFFHKSIYIYLTDFIVFSRIVWHREDIYSHSTLSLRRLNTKVILQCYVSTFRHRKIRKTKGIHHGTFSFYIAYFMFAHIFSCIFLSHFFHHKVINSADIKRYTNFSTEAMQYFSAISFHSSLDAKVNVTLPYAF